MILQVEHLIKEKIKAAMKDKLKAVETHPGNWNKDTIARLLSNAPCVYVGWSMGIRQNETQLKSTWHVYLIGQSLQGTRDVGIYGMAETLMIKLHGCDLEQADALEFKSVKNLFSFGEAKHGICCYEMVFELLMHWPDHVDADSLKDFLSYHSESYQESDSEEESDNVLISATTNPTSGLPIESDEETSND